jgi:hypothetical protein
MRASISPMAVSEVGVEAYNDNHTKARKEKTERMNTQGKCYSPRKFGALHNPKKIPSLIKFGAERF